MAGLSSTGWTGKTTAELIDELGADLKSRLGAELNTQADAIMGVLIGVFAGRLGELWEALGALHASFDPDQTAGEQLEGLAALTGTARREATASTCLVAVDLNAGVTLPAGSRAAVVNAPTSVFETDAGVGPATFRRWHTVQASAVENGPTVANEGSLTQIAAPVAGWNAVSNGDVAGTRWSDNAQPYNLSNGQNLVLKVDGGGSQTAVFNTGEFSNIAAATAAEVAAVINAETTGCLAEVEGGRVRVKSDTTGPTSSIEVVSATAAALGFAVGTGSGYAGRDATLGDDLETDTELRARRVDDLDRAGASTLDTLRAQLLDVDNVVDAVVYHNKTDLTDGFGRLPHTFHAIVYAPQALTSDIAETIFANTPLGIDDKGSQTANVTDSQGDVHAVRWDNATAITIHVDVDIDVLASAYAGDQAVKDAIRAYFDPLRINDDVISAAVKARVLGVAGVYDVTDFDIATAGPPSGDANIPIAFNEIATIIDANITVHATSVTPG